MGSKDIKEKSNKKRKSTHSKGKSEKVKNPRRKKILKIILIIFVLFIIAIAGVCAGIFFGLFGDDFKITKEDLIIENMNTVVLDKDGNEIANLSGEENRTVVSKEEMPDYLPKAFVSIEDERFYQHHGVDIKRTLGATFQYIINGGSSSYGGSTITQQLVKNLTSDKDDTGVAGMIRKVKEMSKAYQVERLISKDQILELYLNIIFLGDKAYGVEVASKYYFNKSCKDLSLAECAFLAGINHSPNAYKPFETDNAEMQEKIKNRTKTVLMKIKEPFKNIAIYGDVETLKYLDGQLALKQNYATEYDDYICNFKVVKNIDEAIEHIYDYSTRHSESIITNNDATAKYFMDSLDSACVYHNASTRFSDGGEFGFGAEVGISTQKLHARGPIGLQEMTSTKYLIYGKGQIR